MSIEIKSPTFPESVADGTVANWVKKEGETVEQDEVIAEIETDKVVLEVVAPVSGTIVKIVKQEGEIVNSSELIAEFNEGNSDVTKSEVNETLSESVPQETKADKLGPAAKRIIAEENIDPSEIKSTGKDGRVTKADLINHLNNKPEDVKIIKPQSNAVNMIFLLVTQEMKSAFLCLDSERQ